MNSSIAVPPVSRSALEHISCGYQFKIFKENGVLAFFSDRAENYSFKNAFPAQVKGARLSFLKKQGIDYRNLVCLEQTHSANIAYVTEAERGAGSQEQNSALFNTDGLITDRPQLPLAVFIADCLAVYFLDPKKRIVAIAHAGWRGTAAGICANLINVAKERFGSCSQDILVAFSPRIKNCCYEVGKEVASLFTCGVEERNKSFYLDLAKENQRQILQAGVREKNIIDCDICTACETAEFFSYRREVGSCGRMMAVVMLA